MQMSLTLDLECTSHACTLHRCRWVLGVTALVCADTRRAVHANLWADLLGPRASGRLCLQVEMVLHIEKEAGAHKRVTATSLLQEALACEADETAQTAGPCYAYAHLLWPLVLATGWGPNLSTFGDHLWSHAASPASCERRCHSSTLPYTSCMPYKLCCTSIT